jgi:hypothetical protein
MLAVGLWHVAPSVQVVATYLERTQGPHRQAIQLNWKYRPSSSEEEEEEERGLARMLAAVGDGHHDPNFRSLRLFSCPLSGAPLQQLTSMLGKGRLQGLQRLSLFDCDLPDPGLARLMDAMRSSHGCPSLQTLDASNRRGSYAAEVRM